MNTSEMYKAEFSFYEPLNDFLQHPKHPTALPYLFKGTPSIKDAIEAQGVPHTEIELIVVNGFSVGFEYHLLDGDYVSVYPVFEQPGISPLVKLKNAIRDEPLFIADVHLGKLARFLRLLGFDTCYNNRYDDSTIIGISVRENKIILTRDKRMLYHKAVTHGYWIRSQHGPTQLKEIITRLNLQTHIHPFSRCMECNGLINPVEKNSILDLLEPKTILYYSTFFRCSGCRRIYWRGSHADRLAAIIDSVSMKNEHVSP